MDTHRFDRVVQSLASPSRRSLVSAVLAATSASLLGAGAEEGLAKKNKKKRKKRKPKPPQDQPTPPQDKPCSPDPKCGYPSGECHNGVCFCPSHEQFCGGTCCSPLWLGQEVCVDNRVCCHPSSACGHECCPGFDECIDGACCADHRACYNDEATKRICCGPDEWCVSPAGKPANLACCPAERVCPPGDDGGECCKPDQTCCDGHCCAAGETCVGDDRTGHFCCTNSHLCDGKCCAVADACVDGQCCSRSALTIRGETCCPSGSGNSYFCGRFKCTFALTGTGPGGCDLWCVVGAEGGLCGPGVPGIPTGENNGRACCCTQPGTSTCVWP